MRMFSFAALLATVAVGSFTIGCTSQSPTASEQPMGHPDAGEVATVSFANEACPIMGGSPKAELVREWGGKTIGFCCDGCPQKWDGLSEEAKAEKLVEASEEAGHNHMDHSHGGHDHPHAES